MFGILFQLHVQNDHDETITSIDASSNDASSHKSIHEDTCHTTDFHFDGTSMINVQDEEPDVQQIESSGDSHMEIDCAYKKYEVSDNSMA